MRQRYLFNFIPLVLLHLIYICLRSTDVSAQSDVNSELTLAKKRLLVLPAVTDTLDRYSIDSELVRQVTNIVTQLGRFEVINRDNLQQILDEQTLYLSGAIDDSVLIDAGKLATAGEALIVKVTDFSQQGVPPHDNEDNNDRTFGEELILSIVKGIFAKRVDQTVEKYPHNIQTQLSVEIENINIETGMVLHSFYISVGHTGGSAGKSRAEAVKKFQREALRELKSIYVLISEVLEINENRLLLLLGDNVGVSPGTVFEITEPDQIRKYNQKEVNIPGETIAFAAVDDVSSEINNSIITRKWGIIRPGYKVFELVKPISAYQYYFNYSVNRRALSAVVLNSNRMLQKTSWAMGLYVSRFIDSYDEISYGAGLKGVGYQRLSSTPALTLRAKIGLDIDYVWRKDDEKRFVNTFGIALLPGVNAEIFISKHMDFILGFTYSMGGVSTEWQRPGNAVEEDSDEESSTTPAVWNNAAPTIDKSGIIISFGIQRYLF